MTTALLLCYYSHSMSLSLGCSLAQLVQYLPSFYPWKSPTEAGSPSEYRAQVHLVATIVMVISNFGTLRCEPVRAVFADRTAFVADADYVLRRTYFRTSTSSCASTWCSIWLARTLVYSARPCA